MKLKLAVIGSGIKACQYLATWVQRNDLELVAVSDVSDAALDEVRAIAASAGIPCPSMYSDWRKLLIRESANIDAIYISTPHALHAEQAVESLKAGKDVLLEKPMVMTVDEAQQVVDAQHRSRKTLMVAYQGGLSPLTQQLVKDVATNKYGTLSSANATIWEGWAPKYTDHWKQDADISGGGFMFDTGAHMMNTLSLVCGAELERISALMDRHCYPVDVVTTAVGCLSDGTQLTLHASGETIPVCESRLELFFTDAIVRLCAWGRWIEIEQAGKPRVRKEQEVGNNIMDVFLGVRAGERANPSPASQGLKMAKLWDAIKASAAAGGQPVNCR